MNKKVNFSLVIAVLYILVVWVGNYLIEYKIRAVNTDCGDSRLSDKCTCKNGNVYLSYNFAPCGTNTPMKGNYCTKDSDCEGRQWAINTGCCNTSVNQCRTHLMLIGSDKIIYKCDPNERKCKKNSDCNEGEFCNLVTDNFRPDKPKTGACTPLGMAFHITGDEKKTFIQSDYRLMWLGAENWCKAQGKRLISYDTLHKLFNCDKEKRTCDWQLTSRIPWISNDHDWGRGWTQESYSSDEAWDFHIDYKKQKVYFGTAARMNESNAICE